jgi:hypothetical protein
MNYLTYDKSLTLEQRWKYSQKLANWLNTFSETIPDEITNLKTQLSVYFEKLKNNQILDCDLKAKKDNSYSIFLNSLAIIALFPLATLGALHCYLPYRFIKNFVEKKFKRDVFWGSTKMILGLFIFSLFNLIIVSILANYLNQPFLIGLIYFVSISMFWLSFVKIKLKINQLVRMSNIKRLNTDEFIKMRQELEERIQQIVPKF